MSGFSGQGTQIRREDVESFVTDATGLVIPRRPGTRGRLKVCGGFDGSSSNDWTAIRLETIDSFQFTPRYGPDDRPTYWNPQEWSGRIPRGEVDAAVHEIFTVFEVERFYCDPRDWQSEIEGWALKFGDEHVVEWDTGRGSTRIPAVYAMLERFVTDLTTGVLTHDGCPMTAIHVGNARKMAKPGDRYILGKPSDDQKIDLAMASVLCHEAAADARAAGWSDEVVDTRMTVWR